MNAKCRGFSLVELLVVVAIIALLVSIMIPVLGAARTQARYTLGMNNQRQIVCGVNYYATDNREFYPESVATIGIYDQDWNWTEPMMLTGYRARSPRLKRSMSAYLSKYIRNPSTMFCPNSPQEHKYLHEAWQGQEEWDNPDTNPYLDPLSGTYCFYWNYTGYLENRGRLFHGPHRQSGSNNEGTLLVSDYFGFDHWRSPGAYGSCHQFNGAEITVETPLSSAYWSRTETEVPSDLDSVTIKLYCGFADGHVESFSSGQVEPMRVSLTADGATPYPEGVGPGIFYLPRDGI